jgi:hypothetical protein
MEHPNTFQNYNAPSISTLISVSNMGHTAGTVFPNNSFTSPCDSSYGQISSPPTVNHFRNRVASYSFYDKNGSIPSDFLLPSLEETPERTTNSTMLHLNSRLRNRIQLPCSAYATTNETVKIKRNDSSFSDFKSMNMKNLRTTEPHEVRKMTRRLSNSANAA